MILSRSNHMNICSYAMKMGNRKTHYARTSYLFSINSLKRNCLLHQKGLKEIDNGNIDSYRYQQSIRCLNVFSCALKEYSTNIYLLTREYDKLKNRKKFDISLSTKLVEAHLNENQIEEATEVLLLTRKNIKHFYIKSSVVKLYIDKCIELNRLEEAKNCIQNEVIYPVNGRILASTLIDLSIALSENGWHESAIYLIKSLEGSKILNDRRTKEFPRILNYYVQKCDHPRLQGDV